MCYFALNNFFGRTNELYIGWIGSKLRIIPAEFTEPINKHKQLFRFLLAKWLDALLLLLVVCVVSICGIIYCQNILWQINPRVFNRCGFGSFINRFSMDGCYGQRRTLSGIYRTQFSKYSN